MSKREEPFHSLLYKKTDLRACGQYYTANFLQFKDEHQQTTALRCISLLSYFFFTKWLTEVKCVVAYQFIKLVISVIFLSPFNIS